MAKKTKTAGSSTPVPALLDRVLRGAALVGVYGALLAPVVLVDRLTAFPYVFFKTLFLQALIALTVPAFLLLVWRQPALRPRRAWLSIALGAYLVALFLSCAFSINPHRAFWGSQERMLGFFPITHFFVWYVMATSLLRTWADWRRLLHWQVVLGLFVALTALAELGDPTIVRVAGVLGNPIFCANYQLAMIGILALLWGRTQHTVLRIAYAVCAVAALVTLLVAGSRGPLLGLGAGITVGSLVWAITSRRWRLLLAIGSGLSLAVAGYVAVVVLRPLWSQHPRLAHLFLMDFDPIRRKLWAMAFAGFLARPGLGWGMGLYEAVFDTHYLPQMLCTGPPELVHDIAHSLLFEHLATTGALGTLAFAAVWATFVVSLWRALRRGWLEVRTLAVLMGLSAAYLVQGQFISDSPSSLSLLFLLLALACAAAFPDFAARGAPPSPPLAVRPSGSAPLILAVLQAGGIFLAWYGSVSPALASHVSLHSGDAFRSGGCGAWLENARRAHSFATPWPSDQLDVLARNLTNLAQHGTLDSCPQWRDLFALARQTAVATYAGHPEHLRPRQVLAKLTLELGRASRDPELSNEARLLYRQMVADSPRRQLYRYTYATLLAEGGHIQEGDAQLAQAFDEAPEMGDSAWALGAYRWRYEKQDVLGSKLIARGADGICRHPLSSSVEAGQLGQAFLVQGNLEGLRSMEKRMEGLFRTDPQLASIYVAIARYQEQAGLLAERDRMLQAAGERDVAVKARLAPLFDGRAKTIAEAEQLTPPPVPNP